MRTFQSIFEADWTEVFGSVGNVANAFFQDDQ